MAPLCLPDEIKLLSLCTSQSGPLNLVISLWSERLSYPGAVTYIPLLTAVDSQCILQSPRCSLTPALFFSTLLKEVSGL